MKQRLSLWLLINFQLLAITGCYFHRPMVYKPDIVLKKDGQPCISIPVSETRFHSNRQFDILMGEVVQEGVGTLWRKMYFNIQNINLPIKYYVQAGECLHFEYLFQENITYSIDFVSTVRGNDEQKTWDREFRIKKDADGTVKLLLDLDAREDK
ncbi:hypothetical protein [Snodgrassella sp.]|uniref:putative T6SS immunity periplasmic lipoprotein n=1 Tax=Snodgrassella sp. TaxID=2815304 RepID=UPI00258EF86A|nr:hypothetical protein [Snodgrassella sp.]MCO6519277.1 hypothetical protein [Snodgrassella sp.]MCO6519278.1 hypothetical protein [Snodgrassella sp.]